jgi:YVTN family beta-propeller protein
MHGAVRRRLAIIALLVLSISTPSRAGFFDDWRQGNAVKRHLKNAWQIGEVGTLSVDTVRAILDRSYSPGLSYWQLVSFLIKADDVQEKLRAGKRADAAYLGLKTGATSAFVSTLRLVGLGGVAAIAQAAAAPIVWGLETFIKDVSKRKLELHLTAYFMLRGEPFNFTHEEITNPGFLLDEGIKVTDDGWILDVPCTGATGCPRTNHLLVGGRPLDSGNAADVYGMARDLWDAEQQRANYETNNESIKELVRSLIEHATCSAPGFAPGSACDTGRLGVCESGTWHCSKGTVKCVPDATPSRDICGDALDNDCDGARDEGCAPTQTPSPTATPHSTSTPFCASVESTCDDSLDEDCDGESDCDDPDCSADPICAASAAEIAYVSNYGSGTVSVLDLRSNSPITSIPVGTYPWGIGFLPDGSRAYVAESSYLPNSPGSAVAVIDTSTHGVIGRIPVGQSPHGLALTPDGTKLYVANFFSGSISVVSTATNTELRKIVVGNTYTAPRDVAVLPGGDKAYVTLFAFGGNTVAVINTMNDTLLPAITLSGGVSPEALALSPSGNRAYVCATDLFIIDTTTDTVAGSITNLGGCNGLAVDRGGTKLYIRQNGSLAVMDLETNTIVSSIAVPGGSDGLAIGSDGLRAYVPSEGGGIVSVVDLAAGQVVTAISTDPGPRILAVVPRP